ncbi:hypothetical protein HDV05_006040 [Chytridiales sp. JEL 0842]|nr:hypothetical protein HDV05_006040 [Chytridiales sp. JEL 0842]
MPPTIPSHSTTHLVLRASTKGAHSHQIFRRSAAGFASLRRSTPHRTLFSSSSTSTSTSRKPHVPRLSAALVGLGIVTTVAGPIAYDALFPKKNLSTLHCSSDDSKMEEGKVKVIKKTSAIVGEGQKPAHHKPDGNGFLNPWESFENHGFTDFFVGLFEWDFKRSRPPPEEERCKVRTPDTTSLNAFLSPSTSSTTTAVFNPSHRLALTWLGHACTLVTSKNNLNVLFDPCWSDRCSPMSFAGPKRITPTPCDLASLPQIDAVVISHNHYDHLDVSTVLKLKELWPDVIFFAPLGNKKWFEDLGVKSTNVVECDWWDEYEVQVKRSEGHVATGVICCTPCQHFTGRTLWDRNETLWSSWGLLTNEGRFWFGGDTGYRNVPKGYPEEDVDKLPHCPAFKEIGHKYGPFDLSAIPIGAYSPRSFMSSIHCNPYDAVEVHVDVKSKKSVGIHWGTFILTDEPVKDPPKVLKEALGKKGLKEEEFGVLEIGETLWA